MKALFICTAIIIWLPFVISRPGNTVPLEHDYCKVNGVNQTFCFLCSHADYNHQDGGTMGKDRPWMG